MASPIEDQGAKALRAVTPADNVALPLGPCRALWVGTGGSLSVVAVDDTAAVTISNVADGSVVPIRAKFVQSATGASNIVALY